MTERPIIFSSPMVRAIIEGRKTQTRRVVTPQPKEDFSFMPLSTELVGITKHGGTVDRRGWLTCPHGVPGDRLWVRETWADGRAGTGCPDDAGTTLYRATDPGWDDNDTGLRWRSPIYMTRDRSRLTLEIVSVRVDRVDHISEMDACAEGVEPVVTGHGPIDPKLDEPGMVASALYREGFRCLWDRLNAKRGYPWESNPWVWAIDFRPLNHSPSTAEAADGGAGAEHKGAPSCPVRQAGHPNTPTAADAAG